MNDFVIHVWQWSGYGWQHNPGFTGYRATYQQALAMAEGLEHTTLPRMSGIAQWWYVGVYYTGEGGFQQRYGNMVNTPRVSEW